MPDFAVSAGGVVGTVGVVVAWASASDVVRTADEATTPNAAAYPRRARTLRRQTCLAFERWSIFLLRFPATEHVISLRPELLIWINFAVPANPSLNMVGAITTLSSSQGPPEGVS